MYNGHDECNETFTDPEKIMSENHDQLVFLTYDERNEFLGTVFPKCSGSENTEHVKHKDCIWYGDDHRTWPWMEDSQIEHVVWLMLGKLKNVLAWFSDDSIIINNWRPDKIHYVLTANGISYVLNYVGWVDIQENRPIEMRCLHIADRLYYELDFNANDVIELCKALTIRYNKVLEDDLDDETTPRMLWQILIFESKYKRNKRKLGTAFSSDQLSTHAPR